jgi:3-deoxy-D-manno-octulosonate 8-phosphate phosphatase (KDO 8-P phosphatase)
VNTPGELADDGSNGGDAARGVPRRASDRRAFADPASIRLLVLDVDGVLPDGRITLDGEPPEPKTFHVRDGLAIRQWIARGGRVAVITGRSSPAVRARAGELGIDPVVQGAGDKAAALVRVLATTGIDAQHTAAMGDDLPDLPMLRGVGLPLAPADAVEEVRAVAAYVTGARGGFGAVREAIEHLMRASGAWDAVVASFDQAPADEGATNDRIG